MGYIYIASISRDTYKVGHLGARCLEVVVRLHGIVKILKIRGGEKKTKLVVEDHLLLLLFGCQRRFEISTFSLKKNWG